MIRVAFTVVGIPRTAGSKRAFPFHKGGGRLGVRVTDNDTRGKDWRVAVVAACREAYRGLPLEGPLSLRVTFRLPRPKGHSGARGLLPSAPAYPTTVPDATKLLRCLEDGLTGVLWHDDAQIVEQVVVKVYGQPGADVVVEAAPPGLAFAVSRPATLPLFGEAIP